jgi:hypothetical protein
MWINGHLVRDLSLAVLANQAGMSERGFSPHYAEATNKRQPARLSGYGSKRRGVCFRSHVYLSNE